MGKSIWRAASMKAGAVGWGSRGLRIWIIPARRWFSNIFFLWSPPIWSIAVPVLGAPALNRTYGPRYRNRGIADHLRRQLFLACGQLLCQMELDFQQRERVDARVETVEILSKVGQIKLDRVSKVR
jgi:hypothetical protein